MTSYDQEMTALRAEMQAELRANAGLLYRVRGTFTKTQNGRRREYPCRFSVKDPVKADRNTVAAAQAFATAEGVSFTDVRLLKVHPDDPRPPEGSTLTTPWDGGTLKVVRWSQPSDFTGQALGLCHLAR